MRWYSERVKDEQILPAVTEARVEEVRSRIVEDRLEYNKNNNTQVWMTELKLLGRHAELKTNHQLFDVYLDESFHPLLEQLRADKKLFEGKKTFRQWGTEWQYVGEIDEDGFACGSGTVKNASGETYTGNFHQDKFHGVGVHVYRRGRYEGTYKDGKKHGKQTHYR